MSVANVKQELDELKNDRIFQAFLVSVTFHVVLFVFLEFAREYKLIEKAREIPLVRNLIGDPYKEIRNDAPLIFVDVSPSQTSDLAPEDALYYSDINSIAANPYPKNAEDVQMDGMQEEVPRTFDQESAMELDPQPLQPTPEEAIPDNPEETLAMSEQAPSTPVDSPPLPDPSDLVMRPERSPTPEETVTPQKQERPRTLAEARAKQEVLSGSTMNQLGGVEQKGNAPSLNVKATGFGSYDRMFIMAVDNRWKQLLNEYQYSFSHSGKVVIDFRLKYDGSISNVRVAESNVSAVLDQLCRRAIIDPSPYRPWPDDMRRVIGALFRDVRFTFHYQ